MLIDVEFSMVMVVVMTKVMGMGVGTRNTFFDSNFVKETALEVDGAESITLSAAVNEALLWFEGSRGVAAIPQPQVTTSCV